MSIFSEMPSTLRRISAVRFGPSASVVTMSSVHFSASTAMTRRDGHAELKMFGWGWVFDMGATLAHFRAASVADDTYPRVSTTLRHTYQKVSTCRLVRSWP